MSLYETFALAIKNILSSKMRTFLTMLGIIIGISAVIVIVGMGNGMTNYMTDSFAELGTNILNVNVSGRGTSRNISVDEMYELVEKNPEYLDKISPSVTLSSEIKVGTETLSSSATGISEDYFEIKDYNIARGRGIEYIDIEERRDVCVVGSYIAQMYYAGNPVGDTIRVGGRKMTIVGVMEQEADEMEEGGTDDCVFLPYSTAARLSWTGRITSFLITVVDEEQIAQSKQIIENALYEVFQDTDAYSIISMSEILDMVTTMLNMVITILAIIAGISLLVGGIGIMNIMLVSVTERTREIGIRKALGAKEGAIMRQFVIEAATTSGLGGIFGIIFGYIFSRVGTTIIAATMDSPIVISPSLATVLLAFGISAAIGILFGFLPARKAARLNPIDALRYD